MDDVYLGGKWKYIHYQRKLRILRALGLIGDDDHRFTTSQALQGIDKYKHPVFGGNDGERIFLLQMPPDFDKACITEAYEAHTRGVSVCVSDDSLLYTDWEDTHEVNNRSVRTEEDLDDIVRRANSASERDRVLFITGCTPQGRVRYYAVNLAE